jgi:hypothetical protein
VNAYCSLDGATWSSSLACRTATDKRTAKIFSDRGRPYPAPSMQELVRLDPLDLRVEPRNCAVDVAACESRIRL